MRDDLNSAPLSPAVLHILLALAGEDRHGYGIMLEIARQSSGKYKMGPGTLYDNLQRLLSQDLVAESPRPVTDDDPRRRYYTLILSGRAVLSAEIVRLEGVVKEARVHLRPLAGKSA